MATETYHGSCHCGAVRFDVDLDLSSDSGRCNCSFCAKVRSWSFLLKPAAFRLSTGQEHLGDYQFGTMSGHHRFCKHCGVAVFAHGDVPELGGAFVSVQVSCLDDVDPSVLARVPIKYGNGRDNDWMSAPAVTSYL